MKVQNKKITIGILAHVDAGKTTLAESILALTGVVRKAGRVDHKDAYLDTYEMEKSRGITIFSKQAEFELQDLGVTLLDTPGHVDFSAEMERTLQVLDYAILVISGTDGIQGHVETLWRLLKRYHIPTFIFMNKMDLPGKSKEELMEELRKRLSPSCVSFDLDFDSEEFLESAAVCDEQVLEKYLETGEFLKEDIVEMIAKEQLFPCFFGAALKSEGTENLLEGIYEYTKIKEYPEEFGARVFKITRDEQGNRLTYLKVTGGTLRVKMLLSGGNEKESEAWEEKVDQIRIYSGAGYKTAQEVPAGTVCAVTGLSCTRCGEGLGIEREAELPLLEPVLTYQIQLPPEVDVHQMFLKLRQLEEEIPELHLVWKEALGEIHAQVMGDVQMEILQKLIYQRFQVVVLFGQGNIVYKETITNTVEGVGHFEPLRHYAEVHLLLEPGERNSGLSFAATCSEDILDKNWQRLILTHLEEKAHIGVLTGAEITDMKITLLAGRAHQKHTEGGDFRQATYRAVRQGLRKAESVLLEPVYQFRLEIPSENVGRAMTDIQKMQGEVNPPEIEGDMAVLFGKAPVRKMGGYQREVAVYTKGRGQISCTNGGYQICEDAEEIISSIGYEPEADMENPTCSVFCAHGAGFLVDWDQVEDYMHVENTWGIKEQEEDLPIEPISVKSTKQYYGGSYEEDKELEAIFERTFGSAKKEVRPVQTVRDYTRPVKINETMGSKKERKEEYLLVDGYNIIFAWEELKELAKQNIESARDKLMDILSDYQGYRKMNLILVFDAYKVAGGQGSVFKYHNIHVVYTKEAETADQYIEKTVHEIGRKHEVTVATSDGLEQIIIMGQGAARLSAVGLYEEIQNARSEIRKEYLNKGKTGEKTYLFDHLSEEKTELMKEVRQGKRSLKEWES